MDQVQAVVFRGGSPDLAYGSLANVEAPTRLIAEGRGVTGFGLNQRAMQQLNCETRL